MLRTTPPAKWGLEGLVQAPKNITDLPWILYRCFRCFKMEHGECCGNLNSPEIQVLGVPGAQGCARASPAQLWGVGGAFPAGLRGMGNAKLPAAILQPLGRQGNAHWKLLWDSKEKSRALQPAEFG